MANEHAKKTLSSPGANEQTRDEVRRQGWNGGQKRRFGNQPEAGNPQGIQPPLRSSNGDNPMVLPELEKSVVIMPPTSEDKTPGSHPVTPSMKNFPHPSRKQLQISVFDQPERRLGNQPVNGTLDPSRKQLQVSAFDQPERRLGNQPVNGMVVPSPTGGEIMTKLKETAMPPSSKDISPHASRKRLQLLSFDQPEHSAFDPNQTLPSDLTTPGFSTQQSEPGAVRIPGDAPSWTQAGNREPSWILSNLPIAAELAPEQVENVVLADAVKPTSTNTNSKWRLLLLALIAAVALAVGLGVGLSAGRRSAAEDLQARADPPFTPSAAESVTMCPKWNLIMIDEISQLQQENYNARRCRIKQLITQHTNSSAQLDLEMCDSAPEPDLDEDELCSPSNLAIWFLIRNDGQSESTNDASADNEFSPLQQFALATMYIAFDGQGGSNEVNAGYACALDGINCRDGNVIEFSFSTSTLRGNIPSEIRFLSDLNVFRISESAISGSLPVELFELTSLRVIFLEQNIISGSLPTEIGMLSNLNEFNVASNRMTGTIPTEVGYLSGMTMGFQMAQNDLTGSIPSEFGQLSRLEYLRLFTNGLTGEIPTEIGNMTQLLVFDVEENSLKGTLPTEIGNLHRLNEVWVAVSNLTSSIPSELFKLVNLREIHFGDSAFTGTIPAMIENLTGLERLRLENNKLMGPLPSELGMLENVYEMSVWRNNIGGTLPSELGRMTRLQSLYLGDNELTGTLPDSWAPLNRLRMLSISGNRLEGSIDNLSQLTNLVALYLDRNSFGSSLPASIGNLTSLVRFAAYDNSFTGSIPKEVNQLTDLVIFRADNNRFSGPIPSYLSNLPSLNEMNLGGNSFSGPILFSEFGSTLSRISVDYNMLTGQIPSNLGNLEESLRILTVSNNRLSGNIPDAIGLIRNLEILDLSNNEFLVGSIPDVIGDLSEIRRLSIGGTGLTGTIPSGLCRQEQPICVWHGPGIEFMCDNINCN